MVTAQRSILKITNVRFNTLKELIQFVTKLVDLIKSGNYTFVA